METLLRPKPFLKVLIIILLQSLAILSSSYPIHTWFFLELPLNFWNGFDKFKLLDFTYVSSSNSCMFLLLSTLDVSIS